MRTIPERLWFSNWPCYNTIAASLAPWPKASFALDVPGLVARAVLTGFSW